MNNNLIFAGGILSALVVAGLIAVAGSTGGSSIGGFPLFAMLVGFSFIVQWLLFIPAFIFQTEKFFDLAGSLTFITLALLALVLSNFEEGSLVIAAMVVVWAMRLGSFLFLRIHRAGEDRRFRSIKPDFLQFLMTWTLQGMWVSLTFSAGLAAMTSGREHPVDAVVLAGVVLWFAGFLIEVVADNQKTRFRRHEENANRFIHKGLWRISRHPNYFGEILLWLGITIVALPVLEGWQFATLASPVFVWLLLTKISGVRMLENRARKQWGEDPDYQAYHKRTPMLIPNPFLLRK